MGAKRKEASQQFNKIFTRLHNILIEVHTLTLACTYNALTHFFKASASNSHQIRCCAFSIFNPNLYLFHTRLFEATILQHIIDRRIVIFFVDPMFTFNLLILGSKYAKCECSADRLCKLIQNKWIEEKKNKKERRKSSERDGMKVKYIYSFSCS